MMQWRFWKLSNGNTNVCLIHGALLKEEQIYEARQCRQQECKWRCFLENETQLARISEYRTMQEKPPATQRMTTGIMRDRHLSTWTRIHHIPRQLLFIVCTERVQYRRLYDVIACVAKQCPGWVHFIHQSVAVDSTWSDSYHANPDIIAAIRTFHSSFH